MKIRKITENKKAQIGATITWVAGFFIVFFIIFLFIGFTLFMAGGKKLFFKSDKAGIEAENGNLVATKEFYSFLNTNTKFDGKALKIYNLILGLLESYVDRNYYPDGLNLLEGGNIEDINDLHSSNKFDDLKKLSKLTYENKNPGKSYEENEREILKRIKETFNSPCQEYFYIKFPLGYIYKEPGSEAIIASEKYLKQRGWVKDEELVYLSKTASFIIPFNGYLIKLNYFATHKNANLKC